MRPRVRTQLIPSLKQSSVHPLLQRKARGGASEVRSEARKNAVFKNIFDTKGSQHFREECFSECEKGEARKTYSENLFEVKFSSEATLSEL